MTSAPASASVIASRPRGAGRVTRTVAALHRQGDQMRVVVVSGGPSGARIVNASSFPVGDIAAIATAVSKNRAERVLRVIPGAATVCRVVDLPAGSDAELLAALSLQAEAQSPSTVPAHRRGVGVVEGVSGARHGVIVAWPGESKEPAVRAEDETWTSEAVVLSMLLTGRSPTYAVYADPETDSISVVVSASQRIAIRTVRENARGGAWASAIRQAIQETFARVGASFDVAVNDSETASLILEATARKRLLQVLSGDGSGPEERSADWLDQYGVVALAAIGALAGTPTTRGLYALTSSLREARRSMIERAAMWVAQPRRAYPLIAVSLLAALLGPLGFAAARGAILEARLKKVEGDASMQKALVAVDKRVAVYSELDRRRWPMTKLISDVSGLAPKGLDVEFLQLIAGELMVMRGSAESASLVTKLAESLSRSGVFAGVKIDKVDSASGRAKFDISAKVSRPFAAAAGTEDYTVETLAKRLYGDRAVDVTSGDSKDGGKGGATGSRGGKSGDKKDLFDRGGKETKVAEPPPEALDDAAIAKFDRAAAGREMATRRKAASRPDLDAATKERLKDEVERLRGRLRDLQGGGG